MNAYFKLFIAACLACAAPLVQACGVNHQGECRDDIFKQMDKNGDGVISKKEFDAFHNELFKEMDTNKDGKITREEMDAVHNKKMGSAKDHFYKRFDESDINHDGALSKDEAEIGMPMVFEHFDEFDTNKDGKITKEELSAGMKKMHENMQGKHGDGMMKPEQK